MLKRTVAILGLAVIFAAGCSSNSTPSTDKGFTTASTSVSSTATKSFCDGMASEIGDLFSQYADALNYASASDASQAVRTGNSLVDVGRTWIDTCGHYYPSSKVDSLSNDLDDLEDTLNS
jgi:hypothetical protein